MIGDRDMDGTDPTRPHLVEDFLGPVGILQPIDQHVHSGNLADGVLVLTKGRYATTERPRASAKVLANSHSTYWSRIRMSTLQFLTPPLPGGSRAVR